METIAGNNASGLQLEVISDPAQFAAIAVEWDRLAGCLGDRMLFSSHAWISRSWKRHEKLGRKMHVVLVRDRGELALAAPFARIRDWVGTAKLVAMDSLTPQYNDILVTDNDRLPKLWGMLQDHLRRNFLVRSVRISGVRDDSVTARLLQSIGATWNSWTVAQAVSLEPFSSGDAFLASRSHKTRYNYRRQFRLLERHGSVRFRRIGSGPELAAAVRWIFERKEKWIEEKFGENGWLAAEGTAEFFADMASLATDRVSAHVTAIELDETMIGAILMFRQGGTIFLSKLAHDPEWQKFSPGWLVVMKSMLDGCDEGASTIDFMMGADRWKDRFGGNSVPVANYSFRVPIFPVLTAPPSID
jgi:CelD/BcsL family acetyltransferase involved in cellulose biosynthesis